MTPEQIAGEATAIRALLDAIAQRSAATKTDRIAIGKRLIAVKESLAHGQWLPWLRKEFEWRTERTAQLYMKAAKNETVSHSSHRRNDTPPPPRLDSRSWADAKDEERRTFVKNIGEFNIWQVMTEDARRAIVERYQSALAPQVASDNDDIPEFLDRRIPRAIAAE